VRPSRSDLIRSCIIIAALLLLALSLSGLSLMMSKAGRERFDFRMQYTASFMLRTGHRAELYDYEETRKFQNELVSVSEQALPFDHLAYESLLYLPFSFFRYHTAYFLFFAVNAMLLIVSFRLLRPHLKPLENVWRYLPVAMFVCFLPVTMALVEGQDSIMLLSIMILVTLQLERGADMLAGALLGLASFKFQYALPMVAIFLFWRRWRFVGGFALSALILLGLSVGLTGIPGFTSYFHMLSHLSSRFSVENGMKLGTRPELMPNIRGLVYAMVSENHRQLTNPLTFALSAVVLVSAIVKRPSLPLALTAAALVSYHQTISDGSLLLLPIGLMATWAATNICDTTNVSKRSIFIAALCAVLIIGPSLLLLIGVRFYLLAIPVWVLLLTWDGIKEIRTNGSPHVATKT
jgi:Glycosyltransferase family 87